MLEKLNLRASGHCPEQGLHLFNRQFFHTLVNGGPETGGQFWRFEAIFDQTFVEVHYFVEILVFWIGREQVAFQKLMESIRPNISHQELFSYGHQT